MRVAVSRIAKFLSAALVCIVSTQISSGQAGEWERVKVIQPGKSVEVKLRSEKTFKGRMDAWRADGISVRLGKSVVSIEKSDVASIALLIGRSRGRKALLAGGITGGAVAGVVGAAYAGGSGNCCVDVPAAVVVPVAAGFWGGVAAGIAALFPQHKEVIYSAAPPDHGGKTVR